MNTNDMRKALRRNIRRELGIAHTQPAAEHAGPSPRFKVVRVTTPLRRFARALKANSRVAILFPDSLPSGRAGRRNPAREAVAERIRQEE